MADNISVRPILDHIVILISYEILQELPKRLEGALTVIDGGTHADGRTLNKLILFSDGVYIELIAFQQTLDPERRKSHRWGELEEGTVIDWAHTLPDEKDFVVIQKRVKDATSGATYRDPVAGGRIRSDGVELKWSVASAEDASGNHLHPGTAPFWCLDRTPRHLRVPYQGDQGASSTKHPSGALGVSQVSVTVSESELDLIAGVYDGIHGPASDTSADGKAWSYVVHSGSTQGKHQLVLGKSADQKRHLHITLLGDKNSPSTIEVLPGLTFGVES
ncbi:Glyoxalase-like-dom domain-containing protein [Fusarium falciforme]|uniref:Glyoxalase-like-dom domain-containing protein n=1 Tax=Fusarium falciforme TaxID=195108 RepID=UPI0023018740|nr:Glyoxalase-like-dom domain-containing protein [Fusarium falciforme]WAO95727.1 Glyoxalase-like-dom domain-containing protein [Fusarium falciforme]